MALTVRAHYDGAVIVPDDPVDLPVNEPLRIVVEREHLEDDTASSRTRDQSAALERLVMRAIHGLKIPDSALTRETIYHQSSQ